MNFYNTQNRFFPGTNHSASNGTLLNVGSGHIIPPLFPISNEPKWSSYVLGNGRSFTGPIHSLNK